MPETRRNCRHASKPKLARKDLQGGGVGGESRPSSTHLGIMHRGGDGEDGSFILGWELKHLENGGPV